MEAEQRCEAPKEIDGFFFGFRASYSTSVCGGVLRFVSGFLGEVERFPKLELFRKLNVFCFELFFMKFYSVSLVLCGLTWFPGFKRFEGSAFIRVFFFFFKKMFFVKFLSFLFETGFERFCNVLYGCETCCRVLLEGRKWVRREVLGVHHEHYSLLTSTNMKCVRVAQDVM